MWESIISLYWALEGIIIDTPLIIPNNLTYKKACDAVYIHIHINIYIYIYIYTYIYIKLSFYTSRNTYILKIFFFKYQL